MQTKPRSFNTDEFGKTEEKKLRIMKYDYANTCISTTISQMFRPSTLKEFSFAFDLMQSAIWN